MTELDVNELHPGLAISRQRHGLTFSPFDLRNHLIYCVQVAGFITNKIYFRVAVNDGEEIVH